jgi:serine/threonine protein kinase
VVELYATFRRGQNYSFLFPWANGGNLCDLWERSPLDILADHNQPLDAKLRNMHLWIAQQCLGLSGPEGLGSIHDLKLRSPMLSTAHLSEATLNTEADSRDFGIHGDIKPENILYYDQCENEYKCGVLKISDFGLTDFHTMTTRSNQAPTGPRSPTYRAPEYDITDAYKSRKCDVWALGCVFLELLTWFILGESEVQVFNEQRHQEIDEGNTKGRGKWKEDRFFKKIYADDAGGNETITLVLKSSVRDVSSPCLQWFYIS